MLDEGMSAAGELEELASLISSLAGCLPDVQPTLRRAQAILHRLNAEAVYLRLPYGYVRERTASLADHIAMLLGAAGTTEHTHDVVLGWAMNDLAALRGQNAFGPVLRGTSADNPLTTVH